MVADFNKKQKLRFSADKIAFQAAGILFLIVVVVLIFADFKIYQKKQQLTAQIATYQKQIQDLKNSSKNLKDEIANSDNKDYLEKIAYEQLNEQKPGEKEVIFVTPQKKAEATKKPEGFWSVNFWFGWIGQLWNWLKSKF